TSWDVDKIRALCPAHEAQILRIKPSTSRAPDKVFWMGTESGEYTRKSGYEPLSCLSPSGVSATSLAAWILWFLWTSRNNLVFNAFTNSPTEVLSAAISAARE
ncbi:unnamed protein product, partial [Brassica oleracea]